MGTPQQFSLKWNNYSQHIVTAFEDLRGEDDLTDVTLSCEGKRIKAHKVLLSACSVYFKETFRENPCKHPVIILKGVSFIDLQAVVTFMYNGQVNISQERLSSFLQTAELLQIKGLTDMNDQEEGPVKKRPNTSTIPTPEPIITNVSHGQPSVPEDTSSLITPEIVNTRPPTPKRKRIGPASFMSMQNLSQQQNDSQVPLTNQTAGSSNFSSSNVLSGNIGIGSVMTGSSNTLATSVAGPSGVSSSTGGLLNPETVILPSANMMDPAGSSNTAESYSHGIIKFEEEEVIDEDDDYEKNNLSEDNDSSMHDMLGNVEQESNSMGSFMAGSSSSQQPIKIVSGGQDSAVHVVESGQTNAEGEEESILPFEIARYPIYSTFTSSDGYTVQAQATPVPAKNRVLLLRRKTTEFKTFSGPLNVVPVFGGRLALTATSTPTSMGILRTTTTSNKRKSPAVTRNIDLNEAKEVVSLPDDTWHKCTMCEKKYKCRSSLDSHIKIHQGEIAKCEFCGQTMSRTRDLKRHVATVHRDLLKSEDMPKVEVLLSTPDFPDPLSECEMKL